MSTPPAQRVINLDLTDLGNPLPKNNNYFINILRRRWQVEVTDEPDYLIYSDASNVHRLYTCKKIYWTPEPYRPDFRQCDYAMTTHIIDDPRHLRLPLYAMWMNPGDLVRQPGEYEKLRPLKKEFCCFFTSKINRSTRHRWEFFEKLSRYKKVHSAGRAGNNIGQTVPLNAQAKHEFLQRYKFYMAFENTSIPGYTTEKLIEAMRARCVPIYWGNPRVAEEFNPQSFINAHDFPSMEALLEHVQRVDGDEALYRQYLEAPYFHGNKPNEYFNPDRLLDFFERIFADTTPLISARKRLFGRWRLLKQKPPHVPSWRATQSVQMGYVEEPGKGAPDRAKNEKPHSR